MSHYHPTNTKAFHTYLFDASEYEIGALCAKFSAEDVIDKIINRQALYSVVLFNRELHEHVDEIVDNLVTEYEDGWSMMTHCTFRELQWYGFIEENESGYINWRSIEVLDLQGDSFGFIIK